MDFHSRASGSNHPFWNSFWKNLNHSLSPCLPNRTDNLCWDLSEVYEVVRELVNVGLKDACGPSGNLQWLDEYKGPLRWHTSFNLCVLRLISFSMDCHWAKLAKAPKEEPPSTTKDSQMSMKVTSLGWHWKICFCLFYPCPCTTSSCLQHNGDNEHWKSKINRDFIC